MGTFITLKLDLPTYETVEKKVHLPIYIPKWKRLVSEIPEIGSL